MKRITILVLSATIALSGCATRGAGYSPVVDMQGKDQTAYATDLSDCQAYARRVDPAARAMAGAIVGALLGAAIAPRGYRNNTAGYGGVFGATAGGAQGVESQEVIIKRCLAGRGYNVLM